MHKIILNLIFYFKKKKATPLFKKLFNSFCTKCAQKKILMEYNMNVSFMPKKIHILENKS